MIGIENDFENMEACELEQTINELESKLDNAQTDEEYAELCELADEAWAVWNDMEPLDDEEF